MAYYNVCPKCGCNLDPGEKCDCESLKIEHQETSRFFYSQFLRADDSNGQMSFVFDHPQGGAIGAFIASATIRRCGTRSCGNKE